MIESIKSDASIIIIITIIIIIMSKKGDCMSLHSR